MKFILWFNLYSIIENVALETLIESNWGKF